MRTSTKPNIILINCDDLGYGDLGVYGSPYNKTPALDRLAAEGIRFTDFYMASPLCSPSRGAMMTGCYPSRIGFGSFDGLCVLFPGQGVGLNPSEITIARLLKDAGYATAIVGKWHCGDQPEFLPTRHGFDEYYGLPYSNDMGRQPRFWWPTHPAVPPNPPLPLMENDTVIEEQPDQASLTARYCERSLRFIRQHRDEPFFLYLAHMYVHLPLYVPDRFRKESVNGDYGAAVAAIDWCTDVILHELRSLGIDENTLMIFTSDNGSNCGARGGSNVPLRGTKASMFEGGFRVPCLMRWPGHIPAGAVVEGMTWSMDFYKTLANLAGAAVPTDRMIDGADILPTLLDPAVPLPDRPFFYYQMDELHAVRYGDYKYNGVQKTLYDLRKDVGESVNLFDARSEIVARMESLLAQCRTDLGDTRTGVQGANIRPAGRVANPKTLTEYREDHPYYMAMYDKPDAG